MRLYAWSGQRAAALPPDAVAAAQERGRVRDLWATAAELLTELEKEHTSSEHSPTDHFPQQQRVPPTYSAPMGNVSLMTRLVSKAAPGLVTGPGIMRRTHNLPRVD
jgi:hypothetical protein